MVRPATQQPSSSSKPAAWAGARRLLCVRLDAAGDVLMTTPALRALKEARLDRHITLLTSPSGAVSGRLLPECDEVLVYEAPWMRAAAPGASSAGDRAMVEALRRADFDAAAIFTVYSQNPLPAALLCYLAEIPLRLAHCRENPYGLLTDWVKETEPERGVRHEVRRQLELVASVGCGTADERLSVRVPPRARSQLDALLADRGVAADSSWLVVHPGASAPSRRYPPELFADAARRLVLEHGLEVVFTGTADELELVQAVRDKMNAPSVSLAGELDFAGLAALLERAPLLVSNNTGPAHLAAGVGTPVVDLYALTNPQHTPWGVPSRVLFHDVPCRYCLKSVCPEGHHDCLRLVPPEAVVQAALELLGLASAEGKEAPMPDYASVPGREGIPLPLVGDGL